VQPDNLAEHTLTSFPAALFEKRFQIFFFAARYFNGNLGNEDVTVQNLDAQL